MRCSIFLTCCGSVIVAACSQTPPGPDDGGDFDSGPASGTVQGAFNEANTGADAITVTDAVVIAANSYKAASGVTGTFYIQDQAPNSHNGISVYVADTDSVTFPSVGDIVTVTGTLGIYELSLIHI